jgi:hypothetical protein
MTNSVLWVSNTSMRRVAICITALLLFFTVLAHAQTDSRISLKVRLSQSGPFRIGEVIPLELCFSASVADTFVLNTRSYDRSGRLHIDTFEIEPQVRDPLGRYFEAGIFELGGLLSGPSPLGGDPQCIRVQLNEWAAFDAGGSYRLQVRSRRVAPKARPWVETLSLTADPLDIRIEEASSDWKAVTLAGAVALLDSETASAEEKKAAKRVLRFLNTPESMREIVSRAARPGVTPDWDLLAGLHGYPRAGEVADVIRHRLAEPEAAITAPLMSAWAAARFAAAHPPLAPRPPVGQAAQAQWSETFRSRQAEREKITEACNQEAAAFLALKTGAARAESLQTLIRPETGKKNAAVSREDLAASFGDLTRGQQSDLLQFGWSLIRSPAMLPPLKRLLSAKTLGHAPLRGLALRRLYELDPGEGRQHILAEIKSPHSENNRYVAVEELSGLPETSLPELDELLATRLELRQSATRALDAALLARYGTKRIASRVRKAYETAGEPWDCHEADPALAFLIRVDPEYKVTLREPVRAWCLEQTWQALQQQKRFAEAEPLLNALLTDKNLYWARLAAQRLADYGGESAKKALLQRLRAFHEQWKSRAEDFDSVLPASGDVQEAASFQFGLTEALGLARGWVLDDEEITQVAELTLGQHRENILRWRVTSAVTISVQRDQYGLPRASVERYRIPQLADLPAKLKQFPAGTRFRLQTFGPEGADSDLQRTVEGLLANANIPLED